MTNLEALQEWLDTHECAIKGFTVHPDNKPTAEQLAGEILKCLKRLEDKGGRLADLPPLDEDKYVDFPPLF